MKVAGDLNFSTHGRTGRDWLATPAPPSSAPIPIPPVAVTTSDDGGPSCRRFGHTDLIC